jgi:hypothetical protein
VKKHELDKIRQSTEGEQRPRQRPKKQLVATLHNGPRADRNGEVDEKSVIENMVQLMYVLLSSPERNIAGFYLVLIAVWFKSESVYRIAVPVQSIQGEKDNVLRFCFPEVNLTGTVEGGYHSLVTSEDG